MSQARIGRIRMKAGGAEVRLIRQEPTHPNGENWAGKIVEHARRVGAMDEPNSRLVGFVMIGLFSDGGHSLGFRWDANRSPIPRRLLPSYLGELIREDMITQQQAEKTACVVVNRANGFEPDEGA